MASEDGTPLSGAAGQRRLLALLSVLAIAGDAGLSRDKLVGLLWPEADEERARHSLTQALYSARRALDADDLFLVSGDVRLNPARLASDVQDLEAAADAGDLERVATLYQGPFLDGFYLPASSEFEQWGTLHRARLEDRAVAALDRLAEQAEAEGDTRTAVAWRKRLAAIRPLDSSAALKLMAALARAGDRAGALQHARLHELLLRDQLGLDPDRAVAALESRLRDPSAWGPAGEPPVHPEERRALGAGDDRGGASAVATAELAAPATVAVDAAPAAPAAAGAADARDAGAGSAAAPVAAPVSVSAAAPAVPGGRRWVVRRRHLGWLVAAAVALLGGATVVQRARRPAPAPAPSVPRQQVVVAPFRVAGASESLAYLRDGLVELLSARLADDSAARSVDAGAVLAAWRAAGLAGSADVPRHTAVRLAAALGAERVVVGSVVGTPSRAVLSAAVVSVPSGAVTGEATVEGPADSITTLVDRLAGKLLVLQAGEDVSLASQTTSSLPALRAFLDGQAAFRALDYGDALRRYDRAVQLDSTFALAALHLAEAADRLHTTEGRDDALATAWRHRDALSTRDRTLLLALVGPRYPAPSTAAEQLAAWERLVGLAPDRADAWFALGTRLFHDGATLGLPGAPARAAAALRHALSLDSGYVSARALLAHLAARTPAERAAGPLDPDAALADSTGPLAPFVRWRAAVARTDAATLRRLRDTIPRLGRANLRAIAQASQFDGVALDDGARAVRVLRDRGGRVVERFEALAAEHSLAMLQGRRRDALAATERLEDLQPGTHAHLRLRVLDALYGDGSPAAAAAAAGDLQRLVAAPPSAEAAVHGAQLADACVLAQWRLAGGDTTGVRALVDALRGERTPRDLPPVAATPLGCAELLDATLAVTLGRPEAGAAVGRLDSLAFTSASAGDGSAYVPILVARLHDRLGAPPRALDAVRRRSYMTGWPRYAATMLREEGRYAALAGRPADAAAAYERFLTLRTGPDADLAAQADSIRRAAAALRTPAPRD